MSAEEVSFIKGKTELTKKAVELGLKITDISAETEKVNEEYEFNPESHEVPEMSDPKWHSYVMSHFLVDELDNGAPKVEGLRRVTQQLIGRIVSSGPVQVFPSTDSIGPGRATVVYQVEILPVGGTLLTFREVADSCAGNTDPEFVKYPVAIASTRAEARALRKALQIKVVSADEMVNTSVPDEITNNSVNKMVQEETGNDLNEYELITDSQIKVVGALCERLGIDVSKFINSGEKTYESIERVPKATAARMIKKLSLFQKDMNEIPVAIKKDGV